MSHSKQKRKSDFPLRWYMICICISSSLVIAATSNVYLMFKETTMQQVSRQVSYQLEQISGAYDRIETQAYQMHKEMLRDKDLLTFLKLSQIDRVKEFYGVQD